MKFYRIARDVIPFNYLTCDDIPFNFLTCAVIPFKFQTCDVIPFQPVQIEPDHCYTALAVLDGAELSYFGQEGMTEVQIGNVTFQFQVMPDASQIFPIFFLCYL